MAKIGDTKGGTPGTPGALGRVLPLRQKVVDAPTKTAAAKPDGAPSLEADASGAWAPADDEPSAVFDKTASRDLALPDAQGPGENRGGVRARLLALGVKRGDELPIKQADGVRMKETPIGRILDGSVTIESARGFAKLENVVQVTGDLTVQEARLAGGEATPVSTLVEIGGRLTIEGVTS